MLKNYIFKLLCLYILLMLISCVNPFAPGKATDDVAKSALLTQQKTPYGVLVNFQYAYTFKDSLVYSELLDSSFTFISTNFNVTPPEPINWGRDKELKIVGRMFRAFETLDITWNIADTSAINPPNDSLSRIERKLTFDLTLEGGPIIPPLHGEVLFEFVRRGVPPNHKWFISRWRDLII